MNDVWHSPSGSLNPNTGYFGGSSTDSTMDKTTFSSDTTVAVPGANLSVARYSLAATGNSTHGYFNGGTPGSHSRMDKVTYASDTTAYVPGANSTINRTRHAATGNKDAGYFGGGSPNGITTMEKTTYSTDKCCCSWCRFKCYTIFSHCNRKSNAWILCWWLDKIINR